MWISLTSSSSAPRYNETNTDHASKLLPIISFLLLLSSWTNLPKMIRRTESQKSEQEQRPKLEPTSFWIQSGSNMSPSPLERQGTLLLPSPQLLLRKASNSTASSWCFSLFTVIWFLREKLYHITVCFNTMGLI